MNKWKKWFARPAAAVLCTGVLALALSAVPALTLWLGDAGLLAQPHARTQKAGALALTGEDMYLTRVLKKYSRRGSLSGYQRAGTSPDSMYYVEPDGLLFHVEELASAGVLPEEWAAYFMDQIGLSTYQSEDSLGFVNYISYGRRDENLGYYIIGVTVESQSQKVVGLWGTAEEWAGLQEPDAPAVLAAYKTYLGMDSLADWAGPEGTKYAENGLYSASAGLLLACQSGFYVAYPDYTFEAGGDQQRMYFSLSAASVEESTVRGWQEYQRSFGAGHSDKRMRTRRGCRRSSRKRRRWDEADFCTVPCPGAAGRMRARPQRPFLRRAGLLPNGAGAACAHVRRRCAGHCAVERLRNGKQRRRRLLRTGCAGRERRRAGRPYPARIHAFAYGLRYADAGAAVQRAGLRPQ